MGEFVEMLAPDCPIHTERCPRLRFDADAHDAFDVGDQFRQRLPDTVAQQM